MPSTSPDHWKARTPDGRSLLALMPLVIVLGWWSGVEPVQMASTTLFPALLAWQVLWKDRKARHRKPPLGLDAGDDALLPKEAFIAGLDRFLAIRRRRGWGTGVLCVGLVGHERLRRMNGSELADMLLAAAAARIRGLLRKEDLVALHEGGSVLVGLSPRPDLDKAALERIAQRLSSAFHDALVVDGRSFPVNVAVGYCSSAQAPRDTSRSLIEAAEIAMSEARAAGGSVVHHFTSRMQARIQAREALGAELGEALERGEIVAYFQPQICMDDGSVAGFEALARWEHPEKGLISPAEFLPLAEETGHGNRLSQVILSQALGAMRNWHHAGFRVPSIGINFSSEQLRDPRLVERIKWETDKHGVLPENVAIEILETVLCDEDDNILVRNLRALRDAGYAIDLDDFGTGHAAIANIRRFNVNRIKIDRGFIRDLDKDEGQRMLVEAMIRMAESLNVETLAEGVETPCEMSIVAQLGCRFVQGYAVARPMPFRETLAWLGTRSSVGANSQALRRSS